MDDKREAELLKLTELDPDSEISHFLLARFYFDHRVFEKAVSEFRRVLEIKPEYPAAILFLGLSYENSDRKDEAIHFYEEGFKTAERLKDLHLRKTMWDKQWELKGEEAPPIPEMDISGMFPG